MSSITDPYNLSEVLDACSKHAWETRAGEFQRRGIKTETELRQQIALAIESSETRAFRAQPKVDRDQSFGREIYDKRPYDPESNKDYGITVILNPNLDNNGQLYGGTCYIQQRDDFARNVRDEAKRLQLKGLDGPEIVIGGRPALREQEEHRQIVPHEQKLEPEQLAAAVEKPQQEQPAYRPLPGQSAEDYTREMRELSQKQLQHPQQQLQRDQDFTR